MSLSYRGSDLNSALTSVEAVALPGLLALTVAKDPTSRPMSWSPDCEEVESGMEKNISRREKKRVDLQENNRNTKILWGHHG